MKSVALVGCGNLGSIVARGINDGKAGRYRLTCVYDINKSAALNLASDCGCACSGSLEELLETKADYVVEATGPEVLASIAVSVLEAGSNLIALSTGAFADRELQTAVEQAAERTGRKVYVASGAIGGFDLMQAAVLAGSLDVKITNVKSPRALEGAPALNGVALPFDRTVTLFNGNAKEAIKAFPKNVNVAVALAIATVGVENTMVEVVSMPGKELNTHRIVLEGSFGKAAIEVESKPSPGNPRSSAIAALSVLAKLRNLDAPISFC